MLRHCGGMLNNLFRRLAIRDSDLTATAAKAIKRAHGNVFRHLRHFDYWLAHALVRTFSPHLD